MKPVHIAEVVCGALAVYLISAGLLIRGTSPYDAKFVPLGPSASRLCTIVYAPLTWTVYHAPPVVSATLRGYLEWWGCTFPQPGRIPGASTRRFPEAR